MGSSRWERPNKLLASALDLIAQKARTEREWSDHLQPYVGPDHLVMVSDPCERSARLLAFAVTRAVQENQPEVWADHLHRFIFDPRNADTRGIRIFTCRVDKSDRAMQPFNKDEFTNVESGLKPEHYPLKGTGAQDRKFKVINLWERFPEGHNPTTQELLDLVKAEGEDPDFADTKAFLRDFPGEATYEHPLISLCGSVGGRDGHRVVAVFGARSDERDLRWNWLDLPWRRRCRLLVAC